MGRIHRFYRDAVYHGGILDNSFVPPWWEYRIIEHKNANAQDQRLPELIQNNSLYNDIYASMSANELENIDIPAYVVTSWPDHGLHTRGTLLGYEKIASEHKWLEIHGRKKLEWYYSEAAQQRQLQFFDYFLANKSNGMLNNPPVTYEVRSSYYEGETKTASQWPIPELDTQTLYLQASNHKMVTTPTSNTEITSYLADNSIEPEDADMANMSVFDYTFTETTEITGGMNLVLWVSLDGLDDTDFFVGVQKFNAAGDYVGLLGNDIEEGQVANGWLRASHRALDPIQSTPTRPYHLHTSEEKITTGDVFPVEIEILPSSTSFIAGDTLSVVIQGIEIEKSGLVEHESLSNGLVSIHTGEQYPSRLVYSTTR